ncbi:MAG: N-acetylmuramoyl-L-alanine amidase, partial [Coleofasciculaceae cyanobacterium]
MRYILGLAMVGTIIASPAKAEQPLYLAYPPANHQTTAQQIFLVGSAPPTGEVLINGRAISRSPGGNFAPSFPLQLGENLFTVRYQNQELKIKVTRQSTEPILPVGLAFAKDSLTPAVDIAKMPGELICFGAIAPPNATVAVKLGTETIPLMAQTQVQLPPNSAVLTQQNQPNSQPLIGQYQGCAKADPANLGSPQFQLTMNGQTTTQQGSGSVSILSPAKLQVAEVISNEGVARTGPSTDYSRLTPLPKGTRATITGREGGWVRLDYGAWLKASEVRIIEGSVPPVSLIRSVRARQVEGATEIVFPLQVPVPVSVQQGDGTFTLTLYNTTAQTDTIRLDDDPLISRLDWQQVAPEKLQYTFNLKSLQQWGYNLRYEGTSLILTLRHSPALKSRLINPNSSLRTSVNEDVQPSASLSRQYINQMPREVTDRTRIISSSKMPLAGIKILLDPGHGGPEDSGSVGPTGYPEKAVTLIVSKLLRDQLVAKGATVYLTREEDKDLGLQERVDMIEKLQPNISISLHYNALPDDGDAENTKGVGAFWYNTQAHSLAMFLHNYLVQELKRPSYGVFWNNLALTRPHTTPAILLELGFMINPVEFEWVTNPQEQHKLAVALAD